MKGVDSMTIEQPLFWEYAVFKDGELTGIKKDAPKEAVESYEKYLKEKKRSEEQGIKL